MAIRCAGARDRVRTYHLGCLLPSPPNEYVAFLTDCDAAVSLKAKTSRSNVSAAFHRVNAPLHARAREAERGPDFERAQRRRPDWPLWPGQSRPGQTSSRSSPCPLFADRHREPTTSPITRSSVATAPAVLGDVGSDPPRFVAGQQVGSALPQCVGRVSPRKRATPRARARGGAGSRFRASAAAGGRPRFTA